MSSKLAVIAETTAPLANVARYSLPSRETQMSLVGVKRDSSSVPPPAGISSPRIFSPRRPSPLACPIIPELGRLPPPTTGFALCPKPIAEA
jgi:hypothetical protein